MCRYAAIEAEVEALSQILPESLTATSNPQAWGTTRQALMGTSLASGHQYNPEPSSPSLGNAATYLVQLLNNL